MLGRFHYLVNTLLGPSPVLQFTDFCLLSVWKRDPNMDWEWGTRSNDLTSYLILFEGKLGQKHTVKHFFHRSFNRNKMKMKENKKMRIRYMMLSEYEPNKDSCHGIKKSHDPWIFHFNFSSLHHLKPQMGKRQNCVWGSICAGREGERWTSHPIQSLPIGFLREILHLPLIERDSFNLPTGS